MNHKEIIVFGAGNEGKMFADMIQQKKCRNLDDYKILFFCDNNVASGSYVKGIKVISAYDLQDVDPFSDIYICSEKHVDEIMKQLFQLQIKNNIYYVPSYVYNFKYNNDDMPLAIKMDIEKPRLSWLEIEIVKHCNMNCNGCSTCANISPKEYEDIDNFEKNLKQLRKYFSGIKTLKLFGGEPLLHPQIEKFVECARSYFPDSKLLVHSNGLLVPGCKNELLKTMREKNACFVFTLYPETGKAKRKIELKLQQAAVEYEFTEPVYEFRKAVKLKGDYNPQEIFSNCCKCWALIDGKISCGFPYLVKKLEEKYNIDICKNKYQSCIDIYNTDLTGWQINEQLDKPYNMCAYCAFMRFNVVDDEDYYFTWKREKPELGDWMI